MSDMEFHETLFLFSPSDFMIFFILLNGWSGPSVDWSVSVGRPTADGQSGGQQKKEKKSVNYI